MTRSQIVLAAIKAKLCSYPVVAAFGLLGWGVDRLGYWLFRDYCRQHFIWLCAALEFWSSWWWLILITLAYPLLLAVQLMLVRKFAAPGYRLRCAGLVLAIFASAQLVPGVPILLGTDFDDAMAALSWRVQLQQLVVAAISLPFAGLGLYWFLRREPGSASAPVDPESAR